MRIGVFADSHDHVDNVRHAVAEFNRRACELVIFAGDFVSTLILPQLRALKCRIVGCFGDNEGNKVGMQSGFRILGTLGDPPLCFRAPDGTRVVVTHQFQLLNNDFAGCDLVVFAHTHRPYVKQLENGPLLVNPGETSGWTYRQPSIAIVETSPLSAEIVRLPDMPPAPPRQINRSGRYR
jgi:putative phosphoesterase